MRSVICREVVPLSDIPIVAISAVHLLVGFVSKDVHHPTMATFRRCSVLQCGTGG